MNNYSKLIDSHMISFKEALVKNFKKIGLNEIETMVIILLYEQKKNLKKNLIALRDYAQKNDINLSDIDIKLPSNDYATEKDKSDKKYLEPILDFLK